LWLTASHHTFGPTEVEESIKLPITLEVNPRRTLHHGSMQQGSIAMPNTSEQRHRNDIYTTLLRFYGFGEYRLLRLLAYIKPNQNLQLHEISRKSGGQQSLTAGGREHIRRGYKKKYVVTIL